ncbi:uncharacterized protein LOC111318794 isoform X2 [Durio zibethinus]|uniref:Uncharacterized protein LOC111318794 isoform X2 n=1 Tax=Durio zibethinus TaxID=66656 RepID=A0A6P6BK00_DURZI|nr:uncharacterized protein LOC111318794 isoform X2 [Durio zibethinus]
MKDMTENRKLDSASSYDGCGSEEKTSSQKISVSDHINGFQYTNYKPDSFVIDMESFSHGGTSKEINPNSRITLQRSLSRKGSQRGDKKIITPNCVNSNSSSTLDDRDSVAATNPSYRGSSTLEKPTAVAVGSTDYASNPQVHHQITITTGNIAAATDSRFSLRRNSFRRSPPPWLLDPRRILMFFATLSSMGTILLIYFTLSVSKMNGDENALD